MNTDILKEAPAQKGVLEPLTLQCAELPSRQYMIRMSMLRLRNATQRRAA